MRGFFSVEGTFFIVFSKIVDMAYITLLWIIGCIPVVTILTSTATMYQVTVKCIRYDRGSIWREFKSAYLKNLRQGIVLTLFYGVIGAVLGMCGYSVFVLSQSRTTGMFWLAVALVILILLYLANVVWIVPVFSRFVNTTRNLIMMNFVISCRLLLRSVCMILIAALSVMLVRASWPLMILVPSLAVLVLSYPAEPGLHKYMPKLEEDNGDWRYGFK